MTKLTNRLWPCALSTLLATLSIGLTGESFTATAAEVATLTEQNWGQFAPSGKEVDCIYGDYVLRNDRLVAVIAQAAKTRNANMTVKRVGGCLIDFTRRESPNDQLSCYYPHGGAYRISEQVNWPEEFPKNANAAQLAFKLASRDRGKVSKGEPRILIGYELADGADYLTLRSLVSNPHDTEIEVSLVDNVRADGEFQYGSHKPLNLWWCQDDYWPQAYGVAPTEEDWTLAGDSGRRRLQHVQFMHNGKEKTTLAPGESLLLERRLFAANNTFELLQQANALAGKPMATATIRVVSGGSPVEGALLKAIDGDKVVATGKTDSQGKLLASLPRGNYRWVIEAQGRKQQGVTTDLNAGEEAEFEIDLPPLGHVSGVVTAATGGVPCRVAFFGQDVENPNFGPDSAVHGVRNLWHTADGKFEVDLVPGEYELVISRGPEFDAIIQTITVAAGETTKVSGTLTRSVDTTGWISAELHSHSSPSGDNTASQRGRVLNLLVDHLEFIPCTEHQRISTYQPHLKHFAAEDRVLTCSGMELTGSPLPLNHQNAFPLIRRPRRQDGGGPTTHPDPEAQIERLAMWDQGSEKVVQINHPNLAQMIGDRDLNGEPDRGFRQMFHFADVIEVHPLELIYAEPEVGRGGWDGRGNPIFSWMQMLNLGYRVPGVVNTDAHWNYYGSGWLRNYVKSSNDDPSQADLAEICHALEKGQVVMTNGPFLEVEAIADGKSGGPGDDLVSIGEPVRLKVRVQCPNWLDINRVQLFINGRPAPEYNFTRAADAEKFDDGVVKFQQEFLVELKGDAHLIVAASAEDRKLGIVYGEDRGKSMPIAVSNPIFVDYDGGGFQANGDTLGAPLPVEPGHTPTHGHNHSHDPRGE